LRGTVEVDPGGPEVREGVRATSPLDGAEVEAPALVGAGVEIGAGARIEGPAILGDGCRVGAGALVRESILLAGAEIAPEAMLVGAIAGRVTKN
jgi:NDP-sugar pyrophosphorylase family protein